jgi:hypothetical protein
MLLTKEVEIKWNSKNVKMYQSKGYTYTKIGKSVNIKIEDLAPNSQALVNFNCDYCGKAYSQKWVYYNRNIKRSNTVSKDCCNDCLMEKIKESNLINYGIEWTQQTEEVKDKIKTTNIERYGETSYLKTDNFKNQLKKTMIEKYGVENAFASEKIKDKIKNSNLEKYGSEYYSQTEECKMRFKQTIMIRRLNSCVTASKSRKPANESRVFIPFPVFFLFSWQEIFQKTRNGERTEARVY